MIALASVAGWEITLTPPDQYWGGIPKNLHGKIHWYNIPAVIEADDPSNPWNIIKRIYQPGDLVVVKLVRSCRLFASLLLIKCDTKLQTYRLQACNAETVLTVACFINADTHHAVIAFRILTTRSWSRTS